MKKSLLFLFALLCIFISQQAVSQNIGFGTNTPHPSALLDISSTSRGLLIPRMTLLQRNAITSPAEGVMVYQTDGLPGFYFFNGTIWTQISTGASTNFWTLNGTTITNNNTGNVGIGTASPIDKLHIQGGRLRLEETTYPWISFVNGGTLRGFIGAENANLRIGTWPGNTTGSILLRTNGIDRAGLTEDGNFGIGLLNPSEKLHIRGDVRIDAETNSSAGRLQIYGGTNTSAGINFFQNITTPSSLGTIFFGNTGSTWFSNSVGNLIFIGQNGVGINTSSPLARLHIPTGQDAGLGSTTNGYLMLGQDAGANIIIDNNEIIARNNGVAAPLTLQNDGGTVRIGNVPVPNGYLFAVKGKMITEEVRVQLSGNWPDYVFEKSYNLMSIQNLSSFIAKYKHLPNIPQASIVEKEGMEVGDMQKRMMEKIEELTLYIIQLQQQIDELRAAASKK